MLDHAESNTRTLQQMFTDAHKLFGTAVLADKLGMQKRAIRAMAQKEAPLHEEGFQSLRAAIAHCARAVGVNSSDDLAFAIDVLETNGVEINTVTAKILSTLYRRSKVVMRKLVDEIGYPAEDVYDACAAIADCGLAEIAEDGETVIKVKNFHPRLLSGQS